MFVPHFGESFGKALNFHKISQISENDGVNICLCAGLVKHGHFLRCEVIILEINDERVNFPKTINDSQYGRIIIKSVLRKLSAAVGACGEYPMEAEAEHGEKKH